MQAIEQQTAAFVDQYRPTAHLPGIDTGQGPATLGGAGHPEQIGLPRR